MWQEVQPLEKETELQFLRENKKRAKFLVDENMGPTVSDVLVDLGWNTKFVTDIGLQSASDKEIYQYAFKHKRIILTHDDDFLDNDAIPFYCNPGVIVLPGADGNEAVLERAISDMLIVIAPFKEVYQGAKIIFYPDREFKITTVHQDGSIITSRFKFIKKRIYEHIS